MEENVIESNINNQKCFKRTRVLYIIEAAIEYFISVLVGGAYLAKITTELGMSTSLTGILTSFVSLGCGFQFLAIFLVNRKPAKRWITFLHTINQTFFGIVYLVPFFKFSPNAKLAIFTCFLLGGHLLNNLVASPKINMFMACVDNDKRGRFTAQKEIVSLIGGMLYSFAMSAIIDKFEAKGNLEGAFIVAAITIFSFTLIHTLTLVFSKEKLDEDKEKVDVKNCLKSIFKNKKIISVTILAVIWKISLYSSTPFYGSYQVNELEFSMKFVSILSIVYAISRSVFSPIMGKIADKKSFTFMLNICYVIAAVGLLINTFTVPENGKVVYTIYYFLSAVSMAGINSGEINLIYDKVDKKDRMVAYAFEHSVSGVIGFFATLVVSVLVDYIQESGNMLFGLNVYGQQVVSVIGFIFVILTILYLNFFVSKKTKKGDNFMRIVAFGDSITEGCFEVFPGEKSYEIIRDIPSCYVSLLNNELNRIYPSKNIEIINKGLSGRNTTEAVKCFEKEVLILKPDLIIMCFGLNDIGFRDIDLFENNLRTMFGRIKQYKINCIFMTPNTTNYYIDNELVRFSTINEVGKNLYEFARLIEKVQNEGTYLKYMEKARSLVREYGFYLADASKEWEKMALDGIDTTKLLCNHINHPERKMHYLFRDVLLKTILDNKLIQN